MAILGYNTIGSSTVITGAGFVTVTKVNLPAAGTLNELHGWFFQSGGSASVILMIYSDSAGEPLTRLAYTSPIAITGGGADLDFSQTGFSVPLAAGDYWLGFVSNGTGARCYRDATGAISRARSSGAAFNPPDNPWATGNLSSGTTKLSVWAVVGASDGGGPAPLLAQAARVSYT